MKTKPFNLQLALEGHLVVCRDMDDEVKDVCLKGNKIHVTRNGNTEIYDLYGHYHPDIEHRADLRMAVLTEKRWILYDMPTGKAVTMHKNAAVPTGHQLIEIEVEV